MSTKKEVKLIIEKEPVIIKPYDPEWAEMYERLRTRLIHHVGGQVIRVDHIGSTAVPGLAAKPVIDVQISIVDLHSMDDFKMRMISMGFVFREDNPDLTKRYFREAVGMERTHIHVREKGSWSEQFNLLFRDYLRAHEQDCNEYAAIKNQLAQEHRTDRERYVEGKTDIIWAIMKKANLWSQATGWKPEN